MNDAPPLSPQHHPDELILLDYVTGTLATAYAVLIAAHLDECTHCRDAAVTLEAIGGALLDDIVPMPLTDGALERMMARLDEGAGEPPSKIMAPKPVDVGAIAAVLNLPAGVKLPVAIAGIVAREIETYGSKHLKWMPVGFNARMLQLKPAPDGTRLGFLHAKRATRAPRHDHSGLELAYIMAGGFNDDGEQFGPGDFAMHRPGEIHGALADPEGCVVAQAQAGPPLITGWLGFFLNPLLRWL